jgi:hypothetical protein
MTLQENQANGRPNAEIFVFWWDGFKWIWLKKMIKTSRCFAFEGLANKNIFR